VASRRDDLLEVAETFERVARDLLHAHDMQATLDNVVRLAVEHLDACEFAGVSMVEGKQISSPASSHAIPRVLDMLQEELKEGPCIDAIREHEIFLTGDLGAEQRRWPRFALRATQETGVRSILAIRLFAETTTMGALNMYSTQEDAFTDTDVALAAVFSTHAAVAVASARRNAELERSVASRDLIGRAKGILMTRLQLTDDQAFDALRAASQRLNRKLSAIAEDVNYTGDVPGGGA
jgi:GAF domain-containing protein